MAKIGEGMVGKMARLGLAELQMTIYPGSNVGLPPVVSAGSLEHTEAESEFDKLLRHAQERPAPAKDKELER